MESGFPSPISVVTPPSPLRREFFPRPQGWPRMPFHELTEGQCPEQFLGKERKQMVFKATVAFSGGGAW